MFDKQPKLTIKLTGHVDFAENHKMDLSLNRAKKVCSDLIKLGISQNRIILEGSSDTRPFISAVQQKGCKSDIQCLTSLRQLNRRVNFLTYLN